MRFVHGFVHGFAVAALIDDRSPDGVRRGRWARAVLAGGPLAVSCQV
jgi:hypothetical protein